MAHGVMISNIEQAAAFLRSGNHNGAAAALRALEVGEGSQTLQTAVQCLRSAKTGQDDVYVRFVAFRVLAYALTRCRGDRRQQSVTAVSFLLSYAYEMMGQVETHIWTPAVSELATAVAVALKLGCVGDDLIVQREDVTVVCSNLVELVQISTPSHRVCLHRIICQSVVEEFGLYSKASRSRGLPVRVHRRCRDLFMAEGRLPTIIHGLLRGLLGAVGQSPTSVDKGMTALVSCFSWPLHHFFEEDSSTEESCCVFNVAHEAWDQLLLGDISTQCGSCVTMHNILREWYGSGTVNSVPIDRQKVVEVIQLLCSFKGSEWTENQMLRFVESSLSLCLDVFEHLSQWTPEGDYHLFSLLANAILRLVSNYVNFFFYPQAHALVSRLAALTGFLIHHDTTTNSDTDMMSCVDELLSVWFHLTSYIDRCSFSTHASKMGAQRHLISEGCQSIFSAYLQTKVSPGAVEMEEDSFVDTLTNSQLHLIAQVGRVCAVNTCESLIRSLQSLRANFASTIAAGLTVSPSLFEAIWTLLKIVGFFIADPLEGEQCYIPHCFLEMGLQGSSLMLHLVKEVGEYLPLLQDAVPASPAVYAAFLDVFTNYIKTYVEAEESCALYADAFNNGADVVAQSLIALTSAMRVAAFEEEPTAAACRLLDCLADKSSRVRSFCCAQDAFQWLIHAVQDVHRFRFYGHTRGHLIAFALACCPDADSVHAQLSKLALSPSSEDDVNLVLEILSSLAGLFEALHNQQVIRCVFPSLVATGQKLISLSTSKFYEREIAIESVQCVRSMFVTCSPLLEDSGIRVLLDLVVAELRYAVTAMQATSTWSSADSEADKVEFIISTSKLLSSLAQWKALDCFLSDEETHIVSTATVEAAGALLRHMDQRSLSLPNLEDSIFTSLELCAESFTPDFVFAGCTDVFFSAMLYALNSERIHIQRVGISVTASVASFLETATPQANHTSACCDLLSVVLRALISGKVFFSNLRQISRVLLILARGMPYDSLLATLETVEREFASCGAFLSTILSALQSVVGHSNVSESTFEELIQDALSSVHGTTIITT